MIGSASFHLGKPTAWAALLVHYFVKNGRFCLPRKLAIVQV